MPVLVITPAMVLAAGGRLAGVGQPRGRRYGELVLVVCGLLSAGMMVFASDAPRPHIMPALLLAPLPFLLWAAMRLGPGGIRVCLMVGYSHVMGDRLYRAVAVRDAVGRQTVSSYAFLITISIPTLFLAALVEERRRLDEETRRQRDELAHVLRVRTLGELAASITHELSQPLSSIAINAQAGRSLVRSQKPGELMDEILTDIEESAVRAGQVIARRLRALFRKESAQHVGLDIDAVIENVVGVLQSDLRQKSVRCCISRATTRYLRSPATPFSCSRSS